MKYIKGLDGLRAIAVLLVITSHWMSSNILIKSLLLGKIGVDVFFVISGFLITKILFHKKLETDFNHKAILKEIKKFIARRTLRIFPIYYILLLFIYITNGSEFSDYIVYHLTYTSNYLFYSTQKWHGFVGHFWSLAVEEQFYLFWPLLIFFLKKKFTFILLIFTIIVGTFYPYFLSMNMTSILTISCVNAFSIGALLSYVEVFNPTFKAQFVFFIKKSFFILISILLLHLLVYKIPFFPFRLVVSIITLRIIILCVEESFENYFFRILNLRSLSFIGSISYGIYLYHNFIPSYWNRFFRVFKIEEPELFTGHVKLIIHFIILMFVSYMSWVIIEKPFLKLKNKF